MTLLTNVFTLNFDRLSCSLKHLSLLTAVHWPLATTSAKWEEVHYGFGGLFSWLFHLLKQWQHNMRNPTNRDTHQSSVIHSLSQLHLQTQCKFNTYIDPMLSRSKDPAVRITPFPLRKYIFFFYFLIQQSVFFFSCLPSIHGPEIMHGHCRNGNQTMQHKQYSYSIARTHNA